MELTRGMNNSCLGLYAPHHHEKEKRPALCQRMQRKGNRRIDADEQGVRVSYLQISTFFAPDAMYHLVGLCTSETLSE